jgi:hypothetical protein
LCDGVFDRVDRTDDDERRMDLSPCLSRASSASASMLTGTVSTFRDDVISHRQFA